MRVLLLDTNAVSILFKPDNALYATCVELTLRRQLFMSFMTRGELLCWPRKNRWGANREERLLQHMNSFATLYPDEMTCEIWAEIVAESQFAGRPMSEADAWIAATARQWDLPLVTANFRDFEHLREVVLIRVA